MKKYFSVGYAAKKFREKYFGHLPAVQDHFVRCLQIRDLLCLAGKCVTELVAHQVP